MKQKQIDIKPPADTANVLEAIRGHLGSKSLPREIPAALAKALRDGDHLAFEEIYIGYMKSVLDFLHSLTRSFEIAEDLTQEIFVALWEKREKIDPTKSLRGFIYVLARNSALQYLRKQKIATKYMEEAAANVDEYDYDGEKIMLGKEQEILVGIVVAGMPRQRRKIFELSRYEGLSNPQVAERLGITTDTVRRQMTTCMKEIREMLTLFVILCWRSSTTTTSRPTRKTVCSSRSFGGATTIRLSILT